MAIQVPKVFDLMSWGIRTYSDWEREWAVLKDYARRLRQTTRVAILMFIIFAVAFAFGAGSLEPTFFSRPGLHWLLLFLPWVALAFFVWLAWVTNQHCTAVSDEMAWLTDEKQRRLSAWAIMTFRELPGRVVILVYSRGHRIKWAITIPGVPMVEEMLVLLAGRILMPTPLVAENVILKDSRETAVSLVCSLSDTLNERLSAEMPPEEFFTELQAEANRKAGG